VNGFLLAAGVVATATALIHLIAGHFDPVRPLLSSSMAEVPKRTLHGAWHMASVTMALAAAVLLYLAFAGGDRETELLARFIALQYLVYGLVFLVLALSIRQPNRLLRLPQWTMLFPVAVLAWWGTV